MSSVSLKKTFDQINKVLTNRRRELLKKAAKHVQNAMKKKVSDNYFEGFHSAPGEPPGKVTGNLLKGIQNQVDKDEAIVGIKSPGYHAHLLEFGTSKRSATKLKNANRGSMAPRPFVLPTWEEEKETVKAILSESWE
jgi:HK97 gp10 family phage protein